MNLEKINMLHRGPISPNHYELSDNQFGPADRDPLTIDAVLRFVRRSWRLCAFWAVAGVCAGLGLLALASPQYTTSAILLLEDRTLRPFPEAASNSETTDSAYVDSQIQVLQSREVIGHVVDKFDLTKDEEFGGPVGGLRMTIVATLPFLSVLIDSPVPEVARDSLRNVTISRVNEALSIQRVGLSNAVGIGFTSGDPRRAAELANAVAQAYIDSRLELKQKAREEAAAQLRERLAETREKAYNPEQSIQDRLGGTPETSDQARERFRELQNTTETYRSLYNVFLQRYTEAVQQLSYPSARVITPAEPPLRRSWPPSFLILALTGILGAAAGTAHSLLWYIVDRSLRARSDVQKTTGLDCLIVIERLKASNWTLTGPETGHLQEAYRKVSTAFGNAIAKVAVYLQAERINADGSIVGVAAIQEGGGASTTAAHLARIIAQSGQKTLLVDANWQLRRQEGKSEETVQGQNLAIEVTTQSLGIEKLDVLIIRGNSSINALNASQAIIASLLRMRNEYAWIVVDYHAVEATADVAASSSLIDNLVLVAEAGRTTPEALRETLRLLPHGKSSIILNKAYE